MTRSLFLVLCLGVLGCRPENRAGLAPEDDKANLFTPAALLHADGDIRGVKDRYRKELKVQTFPKIPRGRDLFGRFKKLDDEDRERFFAGWARERGRHIDGIYVLICKEPLHVQVEVSLSTRQQKAFTLAEAAQLREVFLNDLAAGRPDDGLQAAVRYVHDRLETNLGPVPAPRPYDWLTMSGILLGLAALWLVLLLVQVVKEETTPQEYAGICTVGQGVGTHPWVGLGAPAASADSALADTILAPPREEASQKGEG